MESRHHVFWAMRDYRSPLEKLLRQHAGLVIPMDDDPHRELHARLLPPHKPTREIMLGIINTLRLSEPFSAPTDGLLVTINYLQELDTKNSVNLSEHFQRQLGYIAL